MKTRYKTTIIAIPLILIIFFVINYDDALDDTPYDLEIIFHEEEHAVEYFVVTGNTNHVEIDIPTDLIDGVFMIHINGENVDDERVSIDGNKVIVNYGQNIESVKLFGSYDLGEFENENYPFGLTGPEMSQQNCNDYVISQWQPRVEDRDMVQQFLEICIQRGFMNTDLVERGKVADHFTTGSIQSAQTSAKGDLEKTIEILEEMYKVATIEEDYVQSIVHVDVDKEEYHTDDVVIISGYVENMMPNTKLNITIRNPLMNMVFVSQVTLSEDGTFTESLPIGGPLWKQNGIYSASVSYGKATDHTEFLYLSDLESDDLL